MADGKVLLEVVVEGKNVKVVQRQVEQVTDAVNENSAAQRRNTKAAQQNAESVSAAEKAHRHFDRGLKGASGSSSNVSKNFSKMRDVIGGSSGLVGAYATLAANLFAASAAFTALQKAAQLEQISSGLTYLGKATGVAMGSLASGLQKAAGYGISLGESMKSVAMVTTAGFDPSYIERLGKVARNTSTALGRDLSDSLDRLVRGAVKLEPELLDELGIMVRIDDATSKYAASLGKSAASLTTFEKQQAFMNAVLTEGEKKFGGIGDSVEINPYDKLSASLQELAKTFLNLVNVALKPFVSFLADNKPVLAAFIAVLSKSVITQAFEAFTDFSKVQAVVAGQQKNLAVAADNAAKRNIETQKSRLKLFDSSFGKWGREQNALLQNAKSVQDYEALQKRAQRSLEYRLKSEARVSDANKAAWAERNAMLKAEIAQYGVIIELEKKRALGIAAGAAAGAAPRRETAFSRLRESIAPAPPSIPAKAATAGSKLATRTAKSLSSLDMDSSFANYRQQLKYAAASGEQYRKSMKGVEQASLTSFARIIPGAGKATVAIRSLGGVAKIAVKGFFAMIPVIGEFVMIAWTIWEVVKAIGDAFKSVETKTFEDALESAKTKLSEVSINSKEVNNALAGQSNIIKNYSQLVEAQSNILSDLNSTFSDLIRKADSAGEGYSDIVEQANDAIKSNDLLTESFKKQSGGLTTLEEWKSKNNKTDKETAKFALELIKKDNVIWHSKLNVIKSLKEATKATTEYLNSLRQTSPLSNYVDTVLNIGKAFDSSVMSFKEGTQETKDYLLTISNLSMEQAKLLGLSAQQFNDLRQLAAEYENVAKAVESYTELASRPINPRLATRGPINKLIEDFNKTVGAESQIREMPSAFSTGETLQRAALDTQRAINIELDGQSKKLEEIKKKTAEILKVAGPIIQKRMEEAKDIKLSLTYQQQIIPILEKINGLDQERIKSRQEELNLIAEVKTLENEIRNLKSGGSGIQSAQQAYDIEKQLYAERRGLIKEETNAKIEQLNLQKQNQVIELSIQRINLRNTLASGNLQQDEFNLIRENYGIISKRLGLIDDSNAELTKREEVIAAETALNNVKNLLVEAQLELLTKDENLQEQTRKNATEALDRLKTTREDQATAEATAAEIRSQLQLREGELLSERNIRTIDEIYATKIRAAQTDEQKQLLALEKNILILGDAINKEKYQNAVDAAQVEMDVFKARADIEQKIIDSRRAVLDNQQKIQEQTLMLQNMKNPAIAEYKLTLEQQYALEAESAASRIRLIQEEAKIKEETIKKEEALLIAQTQLQKADMAIKIADINTRAGTKVFDDTQVAALLKTFDDVIKLIPTSTSAQIEEVRTAAQVAAGEITGSLAKTAEEIYGWSKNNIVTWEGISQAFGERLKEDLRNSVPLVKQLADAFSGAIDSAVDGLVTALIEGKNIFKSIGEAVRNTLLESFSEMAKDSFKQGIKGLLSEVPFFNAEQDKKPDINQAATSIANSNTSIAQSNNAISQTLSQIPAALSSLSCTCVGSAMQTSQPASPYIPTPGRITDSRGVPITGLAPKDNKLLQGTNDGISLAAEKTQEGNWLTQKWGEAQTYATENVGTIAAAGFASIVTAIAAGRSTKSSILGGILGIAGTVVGGMFGGPAGAAFGGQVGAMIGARADFAKGGVMSSSGPMPLQRYASGGVARSPQLALFGEGSKPEAYVPLPDGRTIPVTMSNGSGNVNNISVNVNVEGGQTQEQSTGNADTTEDFSKKLGVAITNAVKQEIFNQQRPGGLLFKGRK